MAKSKFFCGDLYQKMSDDLHLTGKGKRTHDGYLREIRKLADHCQRAPDALTEQQLRRYFLHLKNEKHYAEGSLTVTLSAFKFFFRVTCPRDWKTLNQLKVKGPKTLPEVITRSQVLQIIDACTTERMAVFFWTVYTLGLRLSEALHLQTGDIDSNRRLVHIHRGKGAKDRYIPIPTSTLHWLRQHWLTHKHTRFLFPADGRNHTGMSTAKTPMAPTTPQDAMKLITTKLNFGKKISIHTLRHCYFRYGLTKTQLRYLDKWVRRRIRACYWKQWYRVRTRIKMLLKLGVRRDEAISHGCSGRGAWVMSSSAAVHVALNIEYLTRQGLASLEEIWSKFASKKRTAGCGPACPVV